MVKSKLQRFAEMETFSNVIQPPFEEIFGKDFYLKGKWNEMVFRNENPIVLELGCGKGEYTTGMAARFPEKNFIGIDIKGARMWPGAKQSLQNNLNNVRFLRTRIEFIQSFFKTGEVSEIWITFPDPQLKERRAKKRLTGSIFLNGYRRFLKEDGVVHLKTDNLFLHQYTLKLIRENKLKLIEATDDLYNSQLSDEIRSIRTYYESRFLEQGMKITYLKFLLKGDKEIAEPAGDTLL
jgi:tRNA (guanine-N7-)-methyltransferase